MKIFLILNLAIAAVSAHIQPRIINGKDAAERQFPYQVGLSLRDSKRSWKCSGALIDKNWVLTAAHCTNNATSAIVRLGSIVRSKQKVKYTVSSKNFIVHEDYTREFAQNDISLIKIPTVTYDDDIQKIELPSSTGSTYTDESVIISGWGKTSVSSNARNNFKLQYAVLKVIDNSDCRRIFGSKLIKPTKICAAAVEGTSTSSGDSGGPLVTEMTKELIGISSFSCSKGCGGSPISGFTRVTSYLSWIKEHTRME